MSVLLETSIGNLVIDVNFQSTPLLAYNFLKLSKLNHFFFTPFYDIVRDKSISSGNSEFPASMGNRPICSYVDVSNFDASLTGFTRRLPVEADAKTYDHAVGLVSFDCESDEDGLYVKSQFSITLTPQFDSKNSGSVPFGKVVEGFEVLQTINNRDIDPESLRLIEDVRILQTHIIYDPFPDPPGLSAAIKDNTYPSRQQIDNMRISEFKDLDNGELEESTYQALALELMGDLAHFKVKPSPRTLFLAKLNPITTAESLEIIFGRFGNVVNSHVVQDPKTNKSLCYAFIEFSEKSEADLAYMKLSKGCYIDGRDVVVDFSQSTRNA